MRIGGFFLLFMLEVSSLGAKEAPISMITLLQHLVNFNTAYLPPLGVVGLWSSYDRTGGQADDSGYIRQEDDLYVLAEMEGPGAVTRIWMTEPRGQIKIFLDQSESPIVTCALRDFFSGKIRPFIQPLVSGNTGSRQGSYSIVPIPYERSCKVVCSELGFYEIEYVTYPDGTPVQTFPSSFSPADTKLLTQIVKPFKVDAKPDFEESKTVDSKTYSLTVPAGEQIELASYEGAGILRGLEMKWSKKRIDEGRDLLLAAYWDHELYPSIYCPIYDFFGGECRTAVLGRDNDGRGYCYLPMPFSNHAHLLLENGNLVDPIQFEVTLHVERNVKLPSPLRTFHVSWERENGTPVRSLVLNPARDQPLWNADQNHVALNISGQGHLVGICVHHTPDHEGDELLFTDGGERYQTWLGAGNEGLFNWIGGGDNFYSPLASADANVQGMDAGLRLFFPNPIRFDDHLVLTFEHGPANSRRLDIATAKFWYQEEPHEPFEWIAANKGRYFRQRPLPQPVLVFNGTQADPLLPRESEALAVTATGGTFEPQDMTPHGPDWSDNQQLRFEGYRVGAWLSARLQKVDFSGWYWLKGAFTQCPEGGLFEIEIQDTAIDNTLELYGEDVQLLPYRSRRPVFLHAGEEEEFRITLKGKNPKSAGYVLGMDYLDLEANFTTPASVEVQGLFLPNPQTDARLVSLEDPAGSAYVLGYTVGEHTPRTQRVSANRKTGKIPLGEALSAPRSENQWAWITWTFRCNRSGIYRFEVESNESSPFLLVQNASAPVMLPGRILVGPISLQGDPTVRLDSATGTPLPVQFPVPLHEGENQISWMMSCSRDMQMAPKIYGLQSNEDSPTTREKSS